MPPLHERDRDLLAEAQVSLFRPLVVDGDPDACVRLRRKLEAALLVDDVGGELAQRRQHRAVLLPPRRLLGADDIGEVGDIHPKDKQNIGKRLALWALAKTYGKTDLVYSGPLYKAMKVEGDKIRLSFDHTGGALVSRDGKPLTWFTIAGKEKKFVEAKAEIDGQTIIVSSNSISSAAHFGGMLAGFIFTLGLYKPRRIKQMWTRTRNNMRH